MSNLGAITPTAEFKRIEHYYARFAVPLVLWIIKYILQLVLNL